MAQGNEGVVVTGGSLTAGQVVAGRGARAYATISGSVGQLQDDGRADIAAALENLVVQMRAHADELANLEEMLDSTRLVSEEITKEKPNKLTVRAMLEGITTGAGSVVSVVNAANTLSTAVRALF